MDIELLNNTFATRFPSRDSVCGILSRLSRNLLGLACALLAGAAQAKVPAVELANESDLTWTLQLTSGDTETVGGLQILDADRAKVLMDLPAQGRSFTLRPKGTYWINYLDGPDGAPGRGLHRAGFSLVDGRRGELKLRSYRLEGRDSNVFLQRLEPPTFQDVRDELGFRFNSVGPGSIKITAGLLFTGR